MARLSDSITYGNHAITGDVTARGSLTVDGGIYGDGSNVSGVDAATLDGLNSTDFVEESDKLRVYDASGSLLF